MQWLYNAVKIVFVLVLLPGCSNKVEPRKPITNSSSSTIEQSIEDNKKRYAAEEKAIEKILETIDTTRTYQRSANGFYYTFIRKDSTNGDFPKFGDRVTFEYDAVALNGDTIYTKEELSPITKSLDQEYGIFRGMRASLKLMKTGDEMIVYFPSYAAYGYYGDNNRIGANTPFKSRVKLLGINLEEK
ncbi:gliding motility-associated peptidyl-prolyl isomerase [Nonlabens dokdonensis]|jgi:gliding motility-associated peptidyl-prolyl isomerase|uniref:Peptidyl-prolyl cis-trans isomerase n=2 Tax=Nonlabens dokdonensis TaxID=328515 RepID=L7WE76_NONDD|nr:gliding motility-associated peptidyl-prolyl isomerase GldI [Nonlabens dokdonensis]AGC78404.1 peptidyl-prolyl cis-trans isomerase [Nonlabens dokdonensis DSW-6]PZX38152.1 gliding motility-associated peptidyl-prolyl isomerase [Nonlabens dokdonensis]